MTSKILTYRDVNAKHVRFAYTDVISGLPRITTVYTGTLTVGHGAGHKDNALVISYPLLGLFPGGPDPFGTMGIITVPLFEQADFVGAVGSVALSEIFTKTDDAFWSIFQVRVDLRPITLSPLKTDALAAVLNLNLVARNSEITTVAYNVTVITNFNRGAHGLPPPTLVKTPAWDGTYVHVGELADLVKPGAPNL
jgi:hypothetical protein